MGHTNAPVPYPPSPSPVQSFSADEKNDCRGGPIEQLPAGLRVTFVSGSNDPYINRTAPK